MGYSSSPSSSTTKSGISLYISETMFRAQIFQILMLMGHFACSLLLCGNGPTKLHKMGRPRCPELVHIVLHFVTCVVCDANTMFGWVDFREDGKKRVENRRENRWEGYLDERGRGREKWWGPAIFSLGPPQFNLSKIGRKWGRK